MRQMKKRGFSGTTESQETKREIEHKLVAKKAAVEGFVLLKNEGLLPISTDKKIALYGRGAVKTIKGGTGSGDVNERKSVTIYEGLLNTGYQITSTDWLETFSKEFDEKRLAWRQEVLDKCQDIMRDFFDAYAQTPFFPPTGSIPDKTDADIAMYVISRVAGEGADRYLEKGDYYLTDEETEVIKTLCDKYSQVVLVLNTASVIDLSFIDEAWAKNIEAIILYSQAGMEGGNAFADIISGKENPSGKLTDTWPINYEDIPGANEFSHLNGDVSKELYNEGIYVGYRYFDSFQERSRFCFGYGLSYTDFQIEYKDSYLCKVINDDMDNTEDALQIDPNRVDFFENTLDVSVAVKNVGQVAGKEVAQVYISLPAGKLDKEYRKLGAFAKTGILAPGEEEILDMEVSLYALSSFDESRSAYVLEEGTYGIWVGNSIEDAKLVAGFELTEDAVFAKVDHIYPLDGELTELVLPEDLVRERYERDCAALKEMDAPITVVEAGFVDTKEIIYTDDLYSAASMEKDPILHEAEAFANTLTIDELALLAMGDPLRQHNGQLGAAGSSVPGSAGETNYVAFEKGLAGIPLADGPAGLRLVPKYHVYEGKVQPVPFIAALENGYFYDEVEQPGDTYHQYCTAIPVGVCLAQTWNEELIKEVGAMVGQEMEDLGITLWLAPGMNIHRNPLCGRNFEYYSEDPILSGKIAGAMTLGVQTNKGVGTTIKHFFGNNVEDNRMHNNSMISEKSIREIYLRGFEIAVKETQPMSIMTSYNLVNGVHSANSHDLCMKVARNEWGFKGTIMTDWTTTHENEKSTASGCMRAGNDLIMPGEMSDLENIKAELAAGTLKEEELKRCMIRLICTIFKSNQYEGAVPYGETLK